MSHHSDGVRLRTGAAVLGVVHRHRPNALLSVVDKGHFEVVDRVPCPASDRPAVGKIVAEVFGSIRCLENKVEIVDQLGGGKPGTTLVRPREDGLQSAGALRDVERVGLAGAASRKVRTVVHPNALAAGWSERVAKVHTTPPLVIVGHVSSANVLGTQHHQGLDEGPLRRRALSDFNQVFTNEGRRTCGVGRCH